MCTIQCKAQLTILKIVQTSYSITFPVCLLGVGFMVALVENSAVVAVVAPGALTPTRHVVTKICIFWCNTNPEDTEIPLVVYF